MENLMGRYLKNRIGCFALLMILVVSSPSAFAQATRTWVSGVGDDVNPCSRTAPCKTFAGAISKTAAGGEINVLDPGGYGAVTITKSITIGTDPALGSILNVSTNGVIVNAAATDTITLRGLVIQGAGNALNGLRILSANVVHVQDCNIGGQIASSPNGNGILVANTAGAIRLDVNDTTFTRNGNSASNAAILIKPTGAGSVVAHISNSRLNRNSSGLIVDSSGTTGAALVTIRNSEINGNLYDGVRGKSVAPGNLQIAVHNNMIADNGLGSATAAGVVADGTPTTIRILGNVITANKNGVRLENGGTITSFGGNVISGNSSNGTFSGTQATQ
jgi:hypothetical protein